MLLPTTLVGSYPQPDWLIDRAKLAGRFPPRVRANELWRVAEPYLDQAQDDATLAGHSRSGAGGARHRHRRRDAARELFQPLRHGAGGRGHRQPRQRTGPQRPSQSGAARGRARSAASIRSRSRDVEVPARATPTDRIKMTVPGPFTMAPAGAERLLSRRGGAGAGLCRGGECGDQGSVRRRRRYRADRRALYAGAAREGRANTASRRSTARWRASSGTTAVHICFGYAAIIHQRPTRLFVPAASWRVLPCKQVSIETAQSHLDCSVLKHLPGKTIMLGVLDLSTPRGRNAGDRGGAHPPRACPVQAGTRHRGAGLRHEIPAARSRPSAR